MKMASSKSLGSGDFTRMTWRVMPLTMRYLLRFRGPCREPPVYTVILAQFYRVYSGPARRTLDLAKRSEGGAEMDDESKEQLLSLALVCAVNLAVILLIPVLQGRL